MPQNKTIYTNEDPLKFIESLESEQQKKDSMALLELFEELSNEKAKMFGPTIIGFGTYHYKYDSGHEGMAPLIGFSPRKKAISLYVYSGLEKQAPLLEHLGTFKMGKACIYVQKLSDINLNVLKNITIQNIKYLSTKFQRI